MEYGKVNVNVSQGASHMRPHSKRTDNRRHRGKMSPLLIAVIVLVVLIIIGVVVFLVTNNK